MCYNSSNIKMLERINSNHLGVAILYIEYLDLILKYILLTILQHFQIFAGLVIQYCVM